MISVDSVPNIGLPAISLILIIFGIYKQNLKFAITALWIALLSLLLQYHQAGGEILGSYFNYANAAIYIVSLIVLVTSLIYLLVKTSKTSPYSFYFTGIISLFFVLGSALLIINLAMNAYFIETRKANSPMMQVVSTTPLAYCGYKYVFFKINQDNSIHYLCPNYYGLIPKIGSLTVAPIFLVKQLQMQQEAQSKPVQQGVPNDIATD